MLYLDENNELQHSDSFEDIIEHYSFKDFKRDARSFVKGARKTAKIAGRKAQQLGKEAKKVADKVVATGKKVRRWGYTNGIPNGKRKAGEMVKGAKRALRKIDNKFNITAKNSNSYNKKKLKEAGDYLEKRSKMHMQNEARRRQKGGRNEKTDKDINWRVDQSKKSLQEAQRRMKKAQKQYDDDANSWENKIKSFPSKLDKAVKDFDDKYNITKSSGKRVYGDAIRNEKETEKLNKSRAKKMDKTIKDKQSKGKYYRNITEKRKDEKRRDNYKEKAKRAKKWKKEFDSIAKDYGSTSLEGRAERKVKDISRKTKQAIKNAKSKVNKTINDLDVKYNVTDSAAGKKYNSRIKKLEKSSDKHIKESRKNYDKADRQLFQDKKNKYNRKADYHKSRAEIDGGLSRELIDDKYEMREKSLQSRIRRKLGKK